MEFEHLLKLVNAVSESELTSFSYEENGVKLKIGKKPKVQSQAEPVKGAQEPAEQELHAALTEEDKSEKAGTSDGKLVVSPLVGTFYAAPAEDAEAFVHVGDSVKKGQTLAIVEAMKLMNEIESDFDGIIEEILVENGQAVEYHQPLFRLK